MVSRIQSEIRQTRPFHSLEHEALVSLFRTTDLLQRYVDGFLKTFDLSPTQYNALRILRGAGVDGLPCSEVAERMISRDPDITRLMGRLEKRGLAKRARNQKDRRVITAHITPLGKELVDKLDQPAEQMQQVLLGHLGEKRLRTLIQLLDEARKRPEQQF